MKVDDKVEHPDTSPADEMALDLAWAELIKETEQTA